MRVARDFLINTIHNSAENIPYGHDCVSWEEPVAEPDSEPDRRLEWEAGLSRISLTDLTSSETFTNKTSIDMERDEETRRITRLRFHQARVYFPPHGASSPEEKNPKHYEGPLSKMGIVKLTRTALALSSMASFIHEQRAETDGYLQEA